jgi:hypothetical protein
MDDDRCLFAALRCERETGRAAVTVTQDGATKFAALHKNGIVTGFARDGKT